MVGVGGQMERCNNDLCPDLPNFVFEGMALIGHCMIPCIRGLPLRSIETALTKQSAETLSEQSLIIRHIRT